MGSEMCIRDRAANIFDFDLVKYIQALPGNHQNDGVIAEVRAITRKTS